jgi:hypothetical protein
MKRRALLAAAAVSAAALAGCTTSGDGPGSGETPTSTPEPTPTAEPTPTSEPTPTPVPGPFAVTDTSFEVLAAECGTGEGSAHLTYGNPIIVEGTITGRNACYTAELEDVSYDADADELAMTVRSYNPESQKGCAECISDIDYRAEVAYEGRAPGGVRVTHNGDAVTETTPTS